MNSWLTVDGFGTHGVQSDLNPSHRAPGALDDAVNCRIIGPNLECAGGYEDIGLQAHSGNTLFYQSAFGLNYLFTAGTALWVYGDDEWVDISGGTLTLTPGPDQFGDRWSGGYLQQTMTFCCKGLVRNYVVNFDTEAQPLKWDVTSDTTPEETWEGRGIAAYVMRPFLNFMLAGYPYMTDDSIEWPQRVMWGDPAEPLERPQVWEPTAENLAGSVDLGDSSGHVIDMVRLRNSMIIYKSDSIWTCEYIGGNDVFRFRQVLVNQGISSRDCVVEYNGMHYCLGVQDIFTFDGNQTKSIIYGKAMKTLLADWNQAGAGNNFVTLDIAHEEVIFHYVTTGVAWPSMALAYNVRSQQWTRRDYNHGFRHSLPGNALSKKRRADYNIYGLGSSTIFDVEAGTTQDGDPIPFEIRRTALLADPGHDWAQVDAVKIGIVADNEQAFRFRMGGQLAPSAAINWRSSFDVNPATDYKTDCRENDNYIAWELTADVTEYWQLSNIDLQVQGSGKRG